MSNTVWKIVACADTAYDDEGWEEWWNVTDFKRAFRCETKDDAEWLLAKLQDAMTQNN